MALTPEKLVFEIDLPVVLYLRQPAIPPLEWKEVDSGPGQMVIPAGSEVYLRIKNIDDNQLYDLVKAAAVIPLLTYLNLSENRKITDAGLSRLAPLTRLTRLNLSSCNITNQGIPLLSALKRLEYLDLSYCNRISDEGLRALKVLPRLTFLDLQGCVKTSHAGIRKIERRGLTIHR